MEDHSETTEETPQYDDEGNLISPKVAVPTDPMRVLSFVKKPLVDHSEITFEEASILPESEREVEKDGSPSKRAAAKNLKSWISRLTTFDQPDEDEKQAINQVLGTYGSVRAFLNDLDETKLTNKKLRFREQRFATEPLLRRRRVDMLSPSLLRVLVVALQNELSASLDLIQHCALHEHPLLFIDSSSTSTSTLRNKRITQQPRDQQDLDVLLASGVTGITPVRTSVADLSLRQRDLVESGLREQNRLLRQQVMRLQSCLTSLPWANITTGIQGSPRIGSGFHESGYPSSTSNNNNGIRSHSGSPEPPRGYSPQKVMQQHQQHLHKQLEDPMELLKERLSLCAQQIEKLQHELMRTQSELARTEATVNCQLDIEAKLIEEKAKVMRTNCQLGTFCLKVLHECKPKLAESIVRKESLEGWLEKHPGKDYDVKQEKMERNEKERQQKEDYQDDQQNLKRNKKMKGGNGSRNKSSHNNNNKDVSTMTDPVSSSSSNYSRRNQPESSYDDGLGEEDDAFDSDDNNLSRNTSKNSTPRNRKGSGGSSGRNKRIRPMSSSASQPGNNNRLPDGRRRQTMRRPQTADAKRNKSPNKKSRSILKTKNSSSSSSKTSMSSVASLASTTTNGGRTITLSSPTNNKEDRSTNDLYKSRRLPGIITPLDLSRAVGIDPFSVPSKMEDHRPKDHHSRNKKKLHPDHPTKAMQKPVLFADNIPHSARILRVPNDSTDTGNNNTSNNNSISMTSRSDDNSTSPTKKRDSRKNITTTTNTTGKYSQKYSSPAAAAGGDLVVPKEVVPFLKPVVVKYDRVLRQIFSHFAQTQARPVGSQGLFEEIAQWTTSLTHATFFKILSHFLVVPKLMNKKHAFALLIGTTRMLPFPMFIARLLDVSQLIAPRLFVLSDVASVEMLQDMFIACAEREGLLGNRTQVINNTAAAAAAAAAAKDSNSMSIVNNSRTDTGTNETGSGEETVDIDLEKEKVRAYYSQNLNRIPPISAKSLVAFFMEDAARKWKVLFRQEKILRAIIPENGDGAWGWHDLRSYWWDRCSLSKEAVSSGTRAELMAAFNLPNILPVRHVSPKKRKQMRRNNTEAGGSSGSSGESVLTPERHATAFDLLIDFMVQTELPSTLKGSRRK